MKKERRSRLSLIMLVFLFGGALFWTNMARNEDVYTSIARYLGDFGEVFKQISQRYVDPVDTQDMMLAGIHGMLPNRTARQVMDEMTAAIRAEGGREIAGNFDIRFLYRHDPSVIPPDHPLATELLAAAGAAGVAAEIGAMTASCDVCYYNNRLGVPALVFGGGDLAEAHSNHEHMPVADLAAAAGTLAAMAVRFCGIQRA